MNFQQSYLYWLAGAVLLIVALMSWQDKANPRRFTTGLFWGIYGVLFLLGDWTYSLFGDKRTVHIAVGVAVVVLARGPAAFEAVRLRLGQSPQLVAVAEEVFDPESGRVVSPARWA